MSSELQFCTQVYGRRPYGVGMLVAGYDVSNNFGEFAPNIICSKLYYIWRW